MPGPADGLPPEHGDEDAIARVAAMRRLLVTLGAAVAVLLVVILVGRTGGSGAARIASPASDRRPRSSRLAVTVRRPEQPRPRSIATRTDESDDATFTTYDDELDAVVVGRR